MNRCVISLLALAACDPRTGEVAVAAPTATRAVVDHAVKGVPHGGPIMQVAVTETADAALTFDVLSSLRLWPALDGMRPPVPIVASAPIELALGHAGTDLLAAIRDDSNSVTLLRLGRDGAVHGRAQLSGELGYDQVIAIDDGVLARTPDQAIEWFSADGELRGKVVAEPGQRIQAIATRHGGAAALVRDGATTQLRWLELGKRIAWRNIQVLPAARGSAFAVSPDHHRVAVVDDSTGIVLVYELGLQPAAIIHGTRVNAESVSLGFTDNDHAAVIGSRLEWHVIAPADDAWANTAAMPVPPQVTGGAVGDGVAVTGIFDMLALSNKASTRYLGYAAAGAGTMTTVGNEVLVGFTGTHFAWLDSNLTLKRQIELQTSERRFATAFALDEHHLVEETNTPANKYHLAIVDVDNHESLPVGDFGVPERIEYFADIGVLAVVTRGDPVRRYKVDFAKHAVTEMPTLDINFKGSFAALRLLDPEHADGIVAIALGWPSEYAEHYRLDTYRMERGKLVKQSRRFDGTLARIDGDGTIYTIEGGRVTVQRGAQKLASFMLAPGARPLLSFDSKHTRVALLEGRDVVLRDLTGAQKWRTPVWGGSQVLFAPDDKHVIVRASAGLVVLDAASGERTAMECGWGFGIQTTAPLFRSSNTEPVCEDSTLP